MSGNQSLEERRAKLTFILEKVSAQLKELDEGGEEEEDVPANQESRLPSTYPSNSSKRAKSSAAQDITVVIGTSRLAEDSKMVERIKMMVNDSYREALKEELGPQSHCYQRVTNHEVVDRLGMGDAGLRANRVLHVAFRGETLAPESVVGCMSSTFQPPWTPSGCGHWGLLVVDKDSQGQGIATVLVKAAELRLAGACDEIQIEYEFTPGAAFSERLAGWYEGSLGFNRVGGRSRGEGSEFRKCRKEIPQEVRQCGQRQRLAALQTEIAAELGQLDQDAVVTAA